MDRNEYLKSLGRPAQATSRKPAVSPKPISSLDEYIKMRRLCEKYEEFENISDQLTAADYKKFDRNFDMALHDALYKDEDFVKDEIDRTIQMMKAINWTWIDAEKNKCATPNHAKFIELIRYCYESCFRDGRPRQTVSTGGVTVEIDIVDHLVKIQFSSIDVFAYDNDDSHDWKNRN